jgi:hypothetical protein
MSDLRIVTTKLGVEGHGVEGYGDNIRRLCFALCCFGVVSSARFAFLSGNIGVCG